MESRSVVTAWDPPRMFAREADGWAPGSPPIATEFSVEARAGGVCVVRVVNSLFASTDDWDKQLEGAESGWPGAFRILRIYLTPFRGQRSAMMQVMAPVAGTKEEAWATLTAALGLNGVGAGQRWAAPAGVPALGGVVEDVSQSPCGALLRLDKPGPGTAALYIMTIPRSVIATVSFYLYGAQAAGTRSPGTPLWQARVPKPRAEAPGAEKGRRTVGGGGCFFVVARPRSGSAADKRRMGPSSWVFAASLDLLSAGEGRSASDSFPPAISWRRS